MRVVESGGEESRGANLLEQNMSLTNRLGMHGSTYTERASFSSNKYLIRFIFVVLEHDQKLPEECGQFH